MKNSKTLLKALRGKFSIQKTYKVFNSLDKTSLTNIQNFGKSFIESFSKKPKGFGRFDKKNKNQDPTEDPEPKEDKKTSQGNEDKKEAKEDNKDQDHKKKSKEEKKQDLDDLEKKLREIMEESFKKNKKSGKDGEKSQNENNQGSNMGTGGMFGNFGGGGPGPNKNSALMTFLYFVMGFLFMRMLFGPTEEGKIKEKEVTSGSYLERNLTLGTIAGFTVMQQDSGEYKVRFVINGENYFMIIADLDYFLKFLEEN